MGLRVKEALRLKECEYKERVRGATQLLCTEGNCNKTDMHKRREQNRGEAMQK